MEPLNFSQIYDLFVHFQKTFQQSQLKKIILPVPKSPAQDLLGLVFSNRAFTGNKTLWIWLRAGAPLAWTGTPSFHSKTEHTTDLKLTLLLKNNCLKIPITQIHSIPNNQIGVFKFGEIAALIFSFIPNNPVLALSLQEKGIVAEWPNRLPKNFELPEALPQPSSKNPSSFQPGLFSIHCQDEFLNFSNTFSS